METKNKCTSYTKLCRACLKISKYMKSLLTSDLEVLEIRNMYTSVLNLQLDIKEGTPSQICEDCENKLLDSFKFRVQCFESHQQIRNLHFPEVKQELEFDENEEEDTTVEECENKEDKLEETSNDDIKDSFPLEEIQPTGQRKLENLSTSEDPIEKRSGSNDEQAGEVKHCILCYKTITCSSELRRHMLLVHRQNRSLIRHEKSRNRNTKPRELRCSYCSKEFKYKDILKRHELIHTGEKPYICNVCGKRCTQRGTLTTHMKIHSERQESCHLCDRKFCTNGELRLHLLKHSGEKPFLCSECGKSFYRKSLLNNHVRIHTGETPYKCSICGECFRLSSTLRSHLLKHKNYKPLQCPHCSFSCCRKFTLKQHMKRHSDSTVEETHVCQV